MPSVSREQTPKPTSPRVPARGRGRIRFLGSAARLLAGRLVSSTPGVRRTPSTVSFFFVHADNPTVRMSIFSLLFVLVSFLLLALDAMILSQIIVLVLIYISEIHVVGLLLTVGINIYIAK